MICKICHTNETNNTSGICWECMNKWIFVEKEVSEKQNKQKGRGK
jgi:hypothetical protein